MIPILKKKLIVFLSLHFVSKKIISQEKELSINQAQNRMQKFFKKSVSNDIFLSEIFGKDLFYLEVNSSSIPNHYVYAT